MPSNAIENAAKSTKLIDIPPLITVWLQVRVLPGPPAFARFASFGQASPHHKREAKHAKAAAPEPRRAKAGHAPASCGSSSHPTITASRWPRSEPKYRKQPHAK
jgi:hypothetical protein